MKRLDKRKKIKNSFKLLNNVVKRKIFLSATAAVILFILIFGVNFDLSVFRQGNQASAFFPDSINQSLMAEKSVQAQFQAMEKKMIRENSYIYSANYDPVSLSVDHEEGFGGEGVLNNNLLVQGNAFLSPNNYSLTDSSLFNKNRNSIITYKVQSGDTPSYIAASFGISTYTLLWANNLNYWSIIRPGQELTIPPVSGVIHKVKNGETLETIVKKYKGDVDETIAYNGLPADASIDPGQEIIIPGGQKAIYQQPLASFASKNYYTGPYGSKSHTFPWGQCTWYIAQKRYIPWGGHAKYWLGNARAYGFQTGTEPVPGAIMATNESWYGHVAYVEAVSGNYVTISEMHLGRGVLKTRILNKNDRHILGYIY